MNPSTALVRDFIVKSLADGRAGPGDRVPAERALAERLGQSRSAVRDAMAILESEGLVHRRVGSGTYFTAKALRQDSRRMQQGAFDVSPADLFEARLLLEPQFAELVVANATTADFDRIDHCNRQTAAATTAAQFGDWNGRLHQSIAAATHNDFLVRIFLLATNPEQREVWGDLWKRLDAPELRRAYQAEHEQIVSALRARHVESAKRAIEEHLRHSRRDLLGY